MRILAPALAIFLAAAAPDRALATALPEGAPTAPAATDPHPLTGPAAFTAQQDTLVGTVRAVDYDTNTVEVLTGVGFAIRVEHVRVQPDVPVSIEGREVPLADLRRGQIVRVVYRETADGKVAASLEVVARPDAGGGA